MRMLDVMLDIDPPCVLLKSPLPLEVNRWRDILQMVRNPDAFMTTAADLVVMDRYSYLDVSVVHAIWDEWGLDDVFKHNGRKDIDVVIEGHKESICEHLYGKLCRA
jgi:hypothetical protein